MSLILESEDTYYCHIKRGFSDKGNITFNSGELSEFYSYWLGLPKQSLIPDRSNFRPEEILKLLPRIAILELKDPNFIKLRLVGTDIENFYSQQGVTGTNILNFVRPVSYTHLTLPTKRIV